jgi:dTDP-4-amino-4,6-dideoxygalactose transaminase
MINKLKENQIEANLGAQAINCTSYYKGKYNLKEDDYPNATTAWQSGLALPIGMHLTNQDIETVSGNLIEILINNN